ncbi:uncharacterized protein LOC117955568 isoform X2 [Etheostoma cragini]|uniref:uncharacterized protein LOC117955568 isoform X2 n=1 Tax=Etheostoma cragini TaxID=417921 RepID=UPI00155F4226|nr:uncharacterized protein LOC117955568 isoform X2 [Etheostoma cragini]
MAPFEERGKFGQSEEKGRHSLFSLAKQLPACDRQEEGKLKIHHGSETPPARDFHEGMTRRKRKKKGRGIEVKWRLVFPASTASRTPPPPPPPPPPNSSLVCSGLGDMAPGLGLDCRNISDVEESGIAGKDNENRQKKRETEEREGRETGTRQGMDF